MQPKLKVAVLGVGSLGKEHARIYSELTRGGTLELAGVFDTNRELARKIAEKFRTRAFEDLNEASAGSDALSIVTPTSTHHAIAKPLLEAGKHLLIEKPMTHNGEEAAELVELARSKGCVLQIGHVERFNPVFQYLKSVALEPRFIEAHRLSSYSARSTDIGVVLDLMIHDLDVVLAFVNSNVVAVDAVGVPVLSPSEDIANARLRFANGCVANLTASRISPERMRKIRVFSGGPSTSYVSLDYYAQEGFIYRVVSDGGAETSLLKRFLSSPGAGIVSEFAGKQIVREPVPLEKDEPLKLELKSFVECVLARRAPEVSGESAKRALDLALEITREIQRAHHQPRAV